MFSFHQCWNWKCFILFFPLLPGQSRSSILKVVAFVPQEQKSNNVCEHLVYKCLQYLIFLIKKKKRKKIHLVWVFFFCKAFLTHIQGRLKGFIKTASFMAFFVLIKSTHTLSKKEKKTNKTASGLSRISFPNMSVILWKHQRYSQAWNEDCVRS